MDPEANFHQVREAFLSHWQGQPYERSKGYKVFKRWEWWMEPRVSPTGQRPEPTVFQRAMKDGKVLTDYYSDTAYKAVIDASGAAAPTPAAAPGAKPAKK